MPLHTSLLRREALMIGAGAALGLGLPFNRHSLQAASRRPSSASRSVILVNLAGGLSHLDTLDMKPDAPAEIRGEFKPISTAVPGIQICEHLPQLAARINRWALVRSFSHEENGHLPGIHRLLTGNRMPVQRGSDLDNVLSRRDWPCYGAALNVLRPRADGIPHGVTLPHALIEGPLTWPGQHAGFLGPKHDPMLVTQDPSLPTFKMDTFSLPAGIDPTRVDVRKTLLEQLDQSNNADANFREHQRQAFELLISGKVSTAFKIDQEPAKVRDRYGRNQFGQSLLLARRLVQAGVPIIQANMGIVQTWDTHVDNWGRLKNRLLPWLDQSLAALTDDLEAEGLLETTFIAVMGEFGRTPKISTLPGEKIPGRDHWAYGYSGLFAGAGVVGGRVIGKTDSVGGRPTTRSYTPYDFGATVYDVLGVDPQEEIRDPQNRPTRVCGGEPMRELFFNR